MPRRCLLWMALAGAAPSRADDAPLHVLMDGSIEMPQARFKDGQAVDGLQYHLALELGRRLGRKLRFHLVPRRRLAQLLNEGHEADLICNYMPGWLPLPLQWSRPYLDDADLLVTAARRPAPTQLKDVAGQRIGTVSGFFYPETEATLGAGFLRDDAPNLVTNLRKLASGRVDHAIVGRVTFDYLQRRGEVPLELHPPLVIAKLRTACALAPRSSLSLAQLDAAIAAMQADGSLAHIVDRYR
ncbi:MAG: transporter substrate-binding domain-containing protein [Burkholderiales bacterium]|nr:transporter substrate-binding domain-containing protein [Burkholderiales bacterium]